MGQPKNIRANLVTASLVVIAACLAGPFVARAWDYPVYQEEKRTVIYCRNDLEIRRKWFRPYSTYEEDVHSCINELGGVREELMPYGVSSSDRLLDDVPFNAAEDVILFFHNVADCFGGDCEPLKWRFE